MQVLIDTQHFLPETSLRGVTREEQMSIIIRLPRALNERATALLRPQRLSMSEYLRHALVALTLTATPATSPAPSTPKKQSTLDELFEPTHRAFEKLDKAEKKRRRVKSPAKVRAKRGRK